MNAAEIYPELSPENQAELCDQLREIEQKEATQNDTSIAEIKEFVTLLRKHPEMRDAIKRILTEPEDEAHG